MEKRVVGTMEAPLSLRGVICAVLHGDEVPGEVTMFVAPLRPWGPDYAMTTGVNPAHFAPLTRGKAAQCSSHGYLMEAHHSIKRENTPTGGMKLRMFIDEQEMATATIEHGSHTSSEPVRVRVNWFATNPGSCESALIFAEGLQELAKMAEYTAQLMNQG